MTTHRTDGKRRAPTENATPGSGRTAMTSLLGPPPLESEIARRLPELGFITGIRPCLE